MFPELETLVFPLGDGYGNNWEEEEANKFLFFFYMQVSLVHDVWHHDFITSTNRIYFSLDSLTSVIQPQPICLSLTITQSVFIGHSFNMKHLSP